MKRITWLSLIFIGLIIFMIAMVYKQQVDNAYRLVDEQNTVVDKINTEIKNEELLRQIDYLKAENSRLNVEKEKIRQGALKKLVMFSPNQAIMMSQDQTFFGKIYQNEKLVLEPEAKWEKSRYDQDDKKEYKYLYFGPGKISNLLAFVDGQKVYDIKGMGQEPRISCGEDDYRNDYCKDSSIDKYPPILFFFHPPQRLTSGQHVLEISYEDHKETIIFSVDNKGKLPTSPDLELVRKDWPMGNYDNCTPGAFFDSRYISLPLPNYVDKNIQSKFLVPVNKEADQLVDYLIVDGEKFELILPTSSLFNTNDEYGSWYVDINNLRSGVNKVKWYEGNLLRTMPIWGTGHYLNQEKQEFQLSNSSSCDG